MEYLKAITFIIALYGSLRFATGGILWMLNRLHPDKFPKAINPLSYNVGIAISIVAWAILLYVL